MALHVSRIRIENYRNFLDFEIGGLAPSTVIVGENESGKSNLIQALRLILDPELPSSLRRLREEDFCDLSPGVAKRTHISASVDLTGFEGNPDVEAILCDYYVGHDPLTARLTYKFANDLVDDPSDQVDEPEDGGSHSESNAEPPSPSSIGEYQWWIYGGDDETRTIGPSELQRIALQLVDALRDAENELAVGRRRNPLRELLEDLEPDPEKVQAVTDAMQEASDDLLTDPVVGSVEKLISDELARLSGESLGLSPSLGLTTSDPTKLLKQARLFLDADKKRGIGEVSLGVSNIAYLALLLKTLEKRREKRGRAISILAVEEPEAHLHPQIQRRLFRTLVAEEDGLLVTTHSPHLASVTPIDRLMLLRRDGSRGTVPATVGGADLTNPAKRDIERYLNVTRAELLFARCIIFVEGDAELHLIPALARQAGIDLDELGISVISVQGTDFAIYTKLVSGVALDIPHVVITDGDADVESDLMSATPGAVRAHRLLTEALPAYSEARSVKRKLDDDERREMRIELSTRGYFVGTYTLEIDLIRLFPDTAVAAAKELWSEKVASKFEAGCVDVSLDQDDVDTRSDILARIERIGKGRFSQRWSEHVESGDPIKENKRRSAKTGKAAEHLVDVPGGYVIAALRRAKELAEQRISIAAGARSQSSTP